MAEIFLGKIVRKRNTNDFSIMVYVGENEVTPGGYAAMNLKDFNDLFEFIKEEDQKEWEQYSMSKIAKKMLEDVGREDPISCSVNINYDNFIVPQEKT